MVFTDYGSRLNYRRDPLIRAQQRVHVFEIDSQVLIVGARRFPVESDFVPEGLNESSKNQPANSTKKDEGRVAIQKRQERNCQIDLF